MERLRVTSLTNGRHLVSLSVAGPADSRLPLSLSLSATACMQAQISHWGGLLQGTNRP